jgi:predicted dehydrogenase
MAERLKAVLAGCGGIAGVWLDAIKAMDNLEIVGLVDISEDAAKSRKEQYELGIAITSTDLRSVIHGAGADVVLDCTIPEAHVDVTLTALDCGCHVIGEKPLADSMDNARKMVEAAQKADRIYAVIQNRRYDPNIRALRELADSGKLGDLTTLNCDFYIGAHFGGFRDRMKHVLLLDMAIHTFDAARFISGADPVAVYCKEWNPRGSWYDHDASAMAIFEMTGGIIYCYRGSWCSEGLKTSWESEWRVIGEKGSATWDGAEAFRAQAVAENAGGFFSSWEDLEITPSTDGKQGGHKGLIDDFIRCVQTGGTPETVCTDNIKSLAMCFGAVESARREANKEHDYAGKPGHRDHRRYATPREP